MTGTTGGDNVEQEKRRATYLRVDQLRMLDHWCESLRHTFERPVYLVGSVLLHPRWRDVDVRIILTDKQVRRLPLRQRDLNMLLSRWGQDVTDLPIDCQVQSATEAAAEEGPANPRGLTTYAASGRPNVKETARNFTLPDPNASPVEGAASGRST